MELDDFLAAEQAQGRTVSEDAAFTLNPAQVRAKVATFCAQERLYPFYRCLQGILSVCQSDLFLRHEQGAWVASFAWKSAPLAKHFQGFLLDGATEGFDRVGHGPSQHFFFGLSAALGVPHYQMRWSSPQDGFLLHDGKMTLTEATHSELCQLSFAIDARWWERLAGGQRQLSETEQNLRARLCYSSVPVHIEGQRLLPALPEPPDRPWASRLADGSNLAWRYVTAAAAGQMRAPEVCLDRYRVSQKGKLWYLLNDDPEDPLPISVQFAEAPLPPGEAPSEMPPINRGSADGIYCHSALFLCLEAGRKDWLFPVRDGVLGEPMPISVAKGGVLVVTADAGLRYDLSGMRVICDQHFEQRLKLWQLEAKAMKAQLRYSVANSTVRAESMPAQYYQASGYSIGGPWLGMLAGKVGPALHSLVRRKRRQHGR